MNKLLFWGHTDNLLSTFLDFIYPDNLYCMSCGDLIDRKTRVHCLCDSCIRSIQFISDNPYESVMDSFYFDDLLPTCIYGSLARTIILNFKERGQNYLSKPIGKLMSERVFLSYEKPLPFDFITSIPISKEKYNKRGFNQSDLLAKYISKEISVPYIPLLIKPEETLPMKSLALFDRMQLLEDSFKLNKKIPEGSKILLVDDVFTTGSTANAASKLLKENGAAYVCALVFASGAGPRKS